MEARYEPPRQSVIGQLFDSFFLLLLVMGALFAPLLLGLAGGGKTELPIADKTTWAGLGQTALQQAQWEKLGMTPETAAPIISSRFDYSFSSIELVITAIVVAAYFFILFYLSEIEYRDVIDERFGKRTGGSK